MKPRLTVLEVAKILGVCQQRVDAKFRQGHFPNASLCECGRSIMIPREDVEMDIKFRGKNKATVRKLVNSSKRNKKDVD